MKDITIDNNMFDGCGMNSFWQPACVWFGGYRELGNHITVLFVYNTQLWG